MIVDSTNQCILNFGPGPVKYNYTDSIYHFQSLHVDDLVSPKVCQEMSHDSISTIIEESTEDSRRSRYKARCSGRENKVSTSDWQGNGMITCERLVGTINPPVSAKLIA